MNKNTVGSGQALFARRPRRSSLKAARQSANRWASLTLTELSALPSTLLSLSDPAGPWRQVKARLGAAVAAAGRSAEAVTLVAVSKQQPWSAVEPVLQAGQRVFGENRVQEAALRWAEPKTEIPDLILHLIGPLQTNKVKDAVRLFQVIETLDRETLAKALAEAVQKEAKSPRLYVQVNTGEEAQKAGVAPKDADAFIAAARGSYHLQIQGLMCIPPVNEPAFPHFALLKTIADRNGLEGLSMGMSADFEVAVRFGATSVRVGSAVFGDRA